MQPQRSPDAEATPAARPLRFVTAASLFDGHDAAINIMRRLMQEQGAEVIHLGHNRGVQEIVRAALQEDADGISVSSYQGGHVEYFKYMVDLLRDAGAAHVRVFGGGGGVIVPAEIRDLETYGVERIYSPQDGRQLGLDGMIADMLTRTARHRVDTLPTRPADAADHLAIARCLTAIENHHGEEPTRTRFAAVWPKVAIKRPPVVGITGPGARRSTPGLSSRTSGGVGQRFRARRFASSMKSSLNSSEETPQWGRLAARYSAPREPPFEDARLAHGDRHREAR